MMRILAGLLLGAFFVVGPQALAETISGRVVDIHDADTIAIEHEGVRKKIRLTGLDAPEIDQTCLDKTGAIYNCGVHARDFVIGVVGFAEGGQEHSGVRPYKHVRCELQAKPDPYKRLVGVCFNENNIEINRAIVQFGWAISAYGRNYRVENDAARIAHVGMWQGTFTAPNIWRAEEKLRKLRAK